MGRLNQRKRGPRRRDVSRESVIIDYFLGRAPRPPAFHFLSPAELRATWELVRGRVLESWIKERPCSRPPAWWQYEAAEPRRRLGGVGAPLSEALGQVASLHRGIPDRWLSPVDVALYSGRAVDVHGKAFRELKGRFPHKAIDPNDPPQFESEATYLERHGLLTEAEVDTLKRKDLRDPEFAVLVSDERAARPRKAAAG
jgi:hypothetical protein